jgi:hypothetical protein
MTKTMDRVKKDEDRQAKSLEELEQCAADIAERKKEAAGMSPPPRTDTGLMIRVCRKPILTPTGICELSFLSQSIADSQAIPGKYHGGD